MRTKVSVVIPVYNGERMIDRCVHSLLAQSYPRELTQLIFVDNGSQDQTLLKLATYGDRVCVLEDRRRGSYCARNTGLQQADGDILAFTDLDCIVAEDWLEHLVRSLEEQPQVDALFGQSLGHDGNAVARGMQDSYERVLAAEVIRPDGTCTRIDTRNCAIRRPVFEQIGVFNEELLYWGDEEFGKRLVESGGLIRYCPDAVISHQNLTSADAWIAKKFKEGYWVCRQLRAKGRRYTGRYFPKVLFLHLGLPDGEQRFRKQQSQLEEETRRLHEAVAIGEQEPINEWMHRAMETSFILGTMLARLEESGEGGVADEFHQLVAR